MQVQPQIVQIVNMSKEDYGKEKSTTRRLFSRRKKCQILMKTNVKSVRKKTNF